MKKPGTVIAVSILLAIFSTITLFSGLNFFALPDKSSPMGLIIRFLLIFSIHAGLIIIIVFLNMKRKWALVLSKIFISLMIISTLSIFFRDFSANQTLVQVIPVLTLLVPLAWLLIVLFSSKNIKNYYSPEVV
ncbi:MAG: hypothetical protein GY754_18300 [bacterium]|nr:hypothetical protein [bacterium]